MVNLRPSLRSVKRAHDGPLVLLTALTVNVTRLLCNLNRFFLIEISKCYTIRQHLEVANTTGGPVKGFHSPIRSSHVRRGEYLVLALTLSILASLIVVLQPRRTNMGSGNDSPPLNFPRQAGAKALSGARISQIVGSAPLRFEPFEGSSATDPQFLARGFGYALFFLPTDVVFSTRGVFSSSRAGAGELRDLVRLKFAGSNPATRLEGLERLPGKSHYFLGNDPTHWRTNVPHFARIKYDQLYPGIDLVFYGNQQRFEYDFIVAPGIDPSVIAFSLEGASGTRKRLNARVDASGEVVIPAGAGELRLRKPLVFQREPNAGHALTSIAAETTNARLSPIALRREIDGRYVARGGGRFGFELGAYDPSLPLIIDPVLEYSSYSGGSDTDNAAGIAVDSAGNAYVTGHTFSTNFPTLNPLQPSKGGGADVFITKFNSTGSDLEFSTYFGGSTSTVDGSPGNDFGSAIAVDDLGNAYVTGRTESTDFPTSPGPPAPFQGTCSTCASSVPSGFVVKVDATGSMLLYSTYLGGNARDEANAIAVDLFGHAYVTGRTDSSNFPLQGAFRSVFEGTTEAFVTKLNTTGSGLEYSTFLGGSASDFGEGIAVDDTGQAYVAGFTNSTDLDTTSGALQSGRAGGDDGFISKLNPAGNALVYWTYLGGVSLDRIRGIAIDSDGNAFVTGHTQSTNFPTSSPFQSTNMGGTDGFVSKLNPDGSALVFSTFLGGTLEDRGRSIAVDDSGSAYAAGFTASSDFPVANPLVGQETRQGGQDAFLVKFNAGGDVVYSSFLGGTADEGVSDNGTFVGVDLNENAYVTGDTLSGDFPVEGTPFQTNCASCDIGKRDAFISKVVSIPEPIVFLSPTSLTFGAQGVGTTSAAKQVTLRNRGDEALTISSISIVGANAGQFVLDPPHNCPLSPASMAPGAGCTISVKFQPTTTDDKTAAVEIVDDAADSPQQIPLTGTGITGAFISLSPTSLTYASRPIGSTSPSQRVTLTNPGTVTMTDINTAISGANASDFSQANNCGSSLAANGSCDIDVTFSPSGEGSRTATMTISSGNAQNSPQNVALSGTGTVPDFAISATPSSRTIAAGQRANYTITVTPLLGSTQTVSLSCSGAPLNSSCTITPTSLTLDGTNPSTADVAVRTTARSLAPLQPLGKGPTTGPLGTWWNLGWLFGLVLLLASLHALRQGARLAKVALAASLLVTLVWTACGGGTSSSSGGGQQGTPAGTFTLTFTGTAGSSTHSTTVTLEVQ